MVSVTLMTYTLCGRFSAKKGRVPVQPSHFTLHSYSVLQTNKPTLGGERTTNSTPASLQVPSHIYCGDPASSGDEASFIGTAKSDLEAAETRMINYFWKFDGRVAPIQADVAAVLVTDDAQEVGLRRRKYASE